MREGDCYARYLCRVEELRETQNRACSALDGLPDGPIRSDDRKVVPPPKEELADQHGGGHPPLQAADGRAPPADWRGVSAPSSRRAASSACTLSATARTSPVAVMCGRHRSRTCRPCRACARAI